MNPLVSAFGWLSTHLIVLTLSAFAVAGYWLFVPVSGQPSLGSSSPSGQPAIIEAPVDRRSPPVTSAAVVDKDPPPAVEKSLGDSEPPQSATAPAPARPAPPPPASPPTPRLIGGTLPVYPLAGHDGRESELIGQAFRPPSSGELPEASEDPRERLVQTARRAYWNNEYEASEAAYMALITRYPNDADAFGELGNLYQATAAYDRALDAYYEAGVRLKLAGEFEKLSIVREILLRAQDARASELGPG